MNAWARATINTRLAAGAPPHGLDSGAGAVRGFHPLFEDLRGAALPAAESLDPLTDIEAAFESDPGRKAITAGRNGGDPSTPLGGPAVQHAAR